MPWNFPFWQVLRFACAALVAGNAAVLKHSPNVTGCALAIERLFADAGAPRRASSARWSSPTSELAEATPRIVGDPRVAAVTLTGSERAGAAVAAAAGPALKKTVLELGGSDPFVVLDDADLRGRRGGRGEVAVRQRRPELHRGQAVHRARGRGRRVPAGWSSSGSALLQVGDPTAPGTTVGPMARADLRDASARPGRPAPSPRAPCWSPAAAPSTATGYYYEPTVLDHVRPGMTAFVEETFGPVAVGRPGPRRRPRRRAGQRHRLRPGRRRSGAAPSARSPSAAGSGPARSSSTRSSPPTRGCRSAASAAAATAASCRPRAPASSPTSAPSTSVVRRDRRFDHVGLTVADLDAMTGWYVDAVRARGGVRVRARPGRLPWRHAAQPGRLPDRAAAPRRQRRRPAGGEPGRGRAHPRLRARRPRRAGVDAAYDALLAAGAADRMSPRPSPEPGVRMAYVADPEGNLIELLDRTAATS